MPGANETFRRLIKTFSSQDCLERRAATAEVKRDPLTVAIDRHVVEHDFQTACNRGTVHEDTERPTEEGAVA